MSSPNDVVANATGHLTNTPSMPGSVATMLESARQTLVMLRYRRILWIAPTALVLLGTAAFLLAGTAQDRIDGPDLYCVLAWWGLGTVIVPWVTLFLGVQAVHGGLEDRTSQYLFLRPVRRVPLLLGKWLAIAAVTSALSCCSAVVLYAAIAAHPDLWPDGLDPWLLQSFCLVLSLGSIAYAAVAVFLGATFRRPLAWAAFFVVGLQMLVANLKVSAGMRQLTITDPLRRMVLDLVEPDRRLAKALWPAERDDSLVVELAEGSFGFELGSPLVNLLILTASCLLLGSWRYARTEYESRNRD
jgi:ABC-type transport system involved in multi-copper enzyme maturation permease subunit